MSPGERGRAIVASAHLVSDQASELSELEYGLIIASHAFNRWIVRCMSAAGGADLGPLDVTVLHSVAHRERPKKLADLCLVLNVEDSHTVSYALKKLQRLDLVAGEKAGKETFFSVTAAGASLCARYRQVREDCLVKALGAFAGEAPEELRRRIGDGADLLRALSGLYDQAARAAASL